MDRQRESSGQAPIAGVGSVSGGGESQRKDGGWLLSLVAAIMKLPNRKERDAIDGLFTGASCVFVTVPYRVPAKSTALVITVETKKRQRWISRRSRAGNRECEEWCFSLVACS